MSKHTHGPWIVSEYGDYSDYDGKCRVILGDGGDIRTAVVLGFDTPENRANAQLIAAAPELLEALKAFVEWVELGDHEGEMHTKARAAIAKATGEKA